MQQVVEEERFYANTTILIEAVNTALKKLKQDGYKIPDLTIIENSKKLIAVFDRNLLIQGFINKSYTMWDNIYNRNEAHFLENSHKIFSFLPTDKIDIFKAIFQERTRTGESAIPREVKEEIWGLMHAMIKICIKYIHRNRMPFKVNGVNVYENPEFMRNLQLNLEDCARHWNVALIFPPKYQ